MSVTKEFAVQVDTELATLHDKRWSIIEKIESYKDVLKWYEKRGDEKGAAEYQERIAKARQELEPVKTRIYELNSIYDQDPWTRAFLVTNSNGHVHSSMDCNTCFATTRYQWLIQYSNDDEKTIVEDAGQDACTICYPSAPAEVLNRPSRIVTEDKIAKAKAKAEREEKKAARIAKEKANAPTKSGEFLYFKDGKYTHVIKTERSAVTEWFSQYWTATQKITTHYYDGQAHTEESIQYQKDRIASAWAVCELIIEALAGKHGVTTEEMYKTLKKKYEKKGRN